jgi:hypothetical protein
MRSLKGRAHVLVDRVLEPLMLSEYRNTPEGAEAYNDLSHKATIYARENRNSALNRWGLKLLERFNT